MGWWPSLGVITSPTPSAETGCANLFAEASPPTDRRDRPMVGKASARKHVDCRGFLRQQNRIAQRQYDCRCAKQRVLCHCGEIAEIGNRIEQLPGVTERCRQP